MPPFRDITGQKFERLTVVRRNGYLAKRIAWDCVCDCGGRTRTVGHRLIQGGVKSCGCLQDESRTKHGRYRETIYRIWEGMKSRCYNKKSTSYKNYGGRGITVCDKWKDDFESFVNDVGEMPTKKHWIERIKNNEGYYPGNCKWATPKEQLNNTRSNRMLTFNGTSRTLQQWSEFLNINRVTIISRIDYYGWSVEKALTTPAGKYTRD